MVHIRRPSCIGSPEAPDIPVTGEFLPAHCTGPVIKLGFSVDFPAVCGWLPQRRFIAHPPQHRCFRWSAGGAGRLERLTLGVIPKDPQHRGSDVQFSAVFLWIFNPYHHILVNATHPSLWISGSTHVLAEWPILPRISIQHQLINGEPQ